MTAAPGPPHPPSGFALGARLSVPAMPVMALFAFAFGAFAAQKGMGLLTATAMSAAMFAGTSQFVAVEIWTEPLTAGVIATMALVVAIINLRFLLISASLRPWLGGYPASRVYPALGLLSEPGWLLALRYRAEGGADGSILLGSGVALWLVWTGSTAAGHLLGSLAADPGRYGLDLVMPVFFTVLLVPMWRGRRAAVPWVVAGAVALLFATLAEGSWYIIAGAVAGSLAAEWSQERA
ncbi:MAG TPA: AzlC family ABC transporter permease [Burkholderiales bacterium]|nr:AzlC family ABC transporter permease [Burkholderiales bacterium]